jgi:clan AA aspartic protease (TIGR02281 family)
MGKIMQRNIIKSLFFIALATISLNAWSEGLIFKCKNQQGVLVYQKSACSDNAETVTSWEHKEKPRLPVADPEAEDTKKESSPVLKLKQNEGGHYSTDGDIDGKSLMFLIDTGASFVSLPEAIAHSALIYCDEKKVMNTANGKTDACTAKIKKLQFGPFYVQDVEAVIVPNLDRPLLGMNVLGLFNIAQDKGEMQISVLKKEKSEKTENGE